MMEARRSTIMAKHTTLVGPNCLVTGSRSRLAADGGTKGIGRAIVEELAAFGGKVLTCSRSEEDVEAFVKECKVVGFDVEGVAVDLALESGQQALWNKVQELFDGSLHILVNNAGVNTRGTTVELTTEQYKYVMGINLDSVFLLTKALYPALKKAGGSSVVMLSSVTGGPTTLDGGCPYGISKAATDQLARYLACEWAEDSIRVNSVKPSYTSTPLTKALEANEQKYSDICRVTPLGRFSTVDEIAGIVTFLCTPSAGFISGATIAVDGAFSACGLWSKYLH